MKLRKLNVPLIFAVDMLHEINTPSYYCRCL